MKEKRQPGRQKRKNSADRALVPQVPVTVKSTSRITGQWMQRGRDRGREMEGNVEDWGEFSLKVIGGIG